MHPSFEPGPDDRPRRLPDPLEGAFRALGERPAGDGSDAEVDRAILAAARPRLAARRRLVFRRRLGAVAAVAALILGLVLVPVTRHRPAEATGLADVGQLFGDLDQDGRVDVVDALVLAHDLEDRKPLPAAADLDGDGRIDGRDLDRLMRKIVALEAK